MTSRVSCRLPPGSGLGPTCTMTSELMKTFSFFYIIGMLWECTFAQEFDSLVLKVLVQHQAPLVPFLLERRLGPYVDERVGNPATRANVNKFEA